MAQILSPRASGLGGHPKLEESVEQQSRPPAIVVAVATDRRRVGGRPEKCLQPAVLFVDSLSAAPPMPRGELGFRVRLSRLILPAHLGGGKLFSVIKCLT